MCFTYGGTTVIYRIWLNITEQVIILGSMVILCSIEGENLLTMYTDFGANLWRLQMLPFNVTGNVVARLAGTKN
jgi:hypothetical protein